MRPSDQEQGAESNQPAHVLKLSTTTCPKAAATHIPDEVAGYDRADRHVAARPSAQE